ncbi:MAG: hypothetical protein HQ509_07470 [Candidatus Marinimicrobia bacterium]|nr:hypothetical protein [Candidatus Neomarinimicrobiota bacterium]
MAIIASIINLFLSPADAFSSLNKLDSGKTRTTLLLILVSLGLINLFLLKDLYMDVQYEQTIERIENSERIPEEQKAEILQDMDERFENPSIGQQSIMWLTNALGFPLRVIFMALIVLLIGNFIMGGNLKYGALVNVTALAYMISILELAVKIPLMYYKWSIEVYTGLGLLGIGEPGSFIYYFLNGIDIFGAWRLVVLGIGASLLYNKKPAGFIGALFVYWIIQITITSSIGAVFS